MRKYPSNATSTVRYEYGIELVEGLAQFPETAPTGVAFEQTNAALYAQYEKRVALHTPVLKTRVKVRFAEHHVEKTIRIASRAAEVADGGRRGRIFGVVFPKGLKPVVTPKGKSQGKAMEELIDRLEKSMLAEIGPYRAEWLPKLKNAFSAFTTALSDYAAALKAHDDAFRAEMALREAHHDAVDKIAGIVRAAFPRDKDTQDVIFPSLDDEQYAEEEETRAEPATG